MITTEVFLQDSFLQILNFLPSDNLETDHNRPKKMAKMKAVLNKDLNWHCMDHALDKFKMFFNFVLIVIFFVVDLDKSSSIVDWIINE